MASSTNRSCAFSTAVNETPQIDPRAAACPIGRADVPYVRVATANLLHGRSLTDGLVDTTRMCAAIADLDADVVGIQEVDRFQTRSGNVDQTIEIARHLSNMELGPVSFRFVPAIIGVPGERWTPASDNDPHSGHDLAQAKQLPASYGIGLITRLPVEEWHVVNLRHAPVKSPIMIPGSRRPILLSDEPRRAVVAVLAPNVAPFRTVATAHLSFVPGWNVRQLRFLLRALATLPGPHLLLGDLNLPGIAVEKAVGWKPIVRTPTFPTTDPKIQFDHLLTDDPRILTSATGRAVAMTISDHQALIADLAV